MNNPRGMEYL